MKGLRRIRIPQSDLGTRIPAIHVREEGWKAEDLVIRKDFPVRLVIASHRSQVDAGNTQGRHAPQSIIHQVVRIAQVGPNVHDEHPRVRRGFTDSCRIDAGA